MYVCDTGQHKLYYNAHISDILLEVFNVSGTEGINSIPPDFASLQSKWQS